MRSGERDKAAPALPFRWRRESGGTGEEKIAPARGSARSEQRLSTSMVPYFCPQITPRQQASYEQHTRDEMKLHHEDEAHRRSRQAPESTTSHRRRNTGSHILRRDSTHEHARKANTALVSADFQETSGCAPTVKLATTGATGITHNTANPTLIGFFSSTFLPLTKKCFDL
jgi:hypothetical protein